MEDRQLGKVRSWPPSWQQCAYAALRRRKPRGSLAELFAYKGNVPTREEGTTRPIGQNSLRCFRSSPKNGTKSCRRHHFTPPRKSNAKPATPSTGIAKRQPSTPRWEPARRPGGKSGGSAQSANGQRSERKLYHQNAERRYRKCSVSVLIFVSVCACVRVCECARYWVNRCYRANLRASYPLKKSERRVTLFSERQTSMIAQLRRRTVGCVPVHLCVATESLQ